MRVDELGVGALNTLACFLDAAEICQRQAEHRQHGHLRVGDEPDESLLGAGIDRLRHRQSALRPLAGGLGTSLVHVSLRASGAGSQHQQRITGFCPKSFSTFGNDERIAYSAPD